MTICPRCLYKWHDGDDGAPYCPGCGGRRERLTTDADAYKGTLNPPTSQS